MKQYIVTGDTYRAKQALRQAGFSWDAGNRRWVGGPSAKAELDRIRDPGYGMLYARACSGITISAEEAED